MYTSRLWCSATLTLALLVGLLSGCQAAAGNEVTSSYAGDVRATEVVEVGALRFELWQVQYMPGATGRNPAGGIVVATGGTNVFVNVHNMGTQTARLFEHLPMHSQASPPPPPMAYLEDQLSRQYPATGNGWSQPAGEPEENIGKALPGKTAEVVVMFPPMPRDVTALTMVWEVQLDDGTPYAVTLPVPLPDMSSSSPSTQ